MRNSIEVDILHPFMFLQWRKHKGIRQGLRRYSFIQPQHRGLEEEIVFHQKVDKKGVDVVRKISLPLQAENGAVVVTSDVSLGTIKKGQVCLIAINYLPVDGKPANDNPQRYYPPVFRVANTR